VWISLVTLNGGSVPAISPRTEFDSDENYQIRTGHCSSWQAGSVSPNVYVHPTAEVSSDAELGEGTKIWNHAQIRPTARIGANCVIGKGTYIDAHVVVGNNCKIQNYVSVFDGVTLEDGVFVGPHVCFTNDMQPRAINRDGSLKAATDWVLVPTLIKQGAALGANSTIRCGITIGDWAMVGSGSVVTKDVPDHALVVGNPARIIGWVCACGTKLDGGAEPPSRFDCTNCATDS
jgi:UDP-2-acetamido-3-amino-2,3-dideoxy-glucuronate N-acetyltransferase